MSKESFILFTEQKEVFENLSDEQAGQLIKAIFGYIDNGEEPQLDITLKMAFIPIRQNLDRNNEKWEDVKQKRSEAGKLGAETKKQKQAKRANANFAKNEETKQANVDFAKNKKANQAVNVNDNVNVNDIKIDDNNKYITQLGLNKFGDELPENLQKQLKLYKKVVMALYLDKREDILAKLTMDIISKCWEKMQGKPVDNQILYLKKSIINEVVQNE